MERGWVIARGGRRDSSRGQVVMEYVVIILAVIMAVSWAAGPVRNKFTAYAESIETAMRYLF